MKADRFLCLVLFTLLLICSYGCEKLLNTPPEAAFIRSPEYGDLETIFIFDASDSYDKETENWRLKVRWDADDDGSWDSDYSIEKRFGYQFHTEGQHIIRLEVLDTYGGVSQSTDTVMIAPVIKDSVWTDPRDQQTYRIVRIYGTWWMAENLRYGTRVAPGEFCRDNGITEYYSKVDTVTGLDEYGAYYTWKEASDYYRDEIKGICPDGWHIVSYSDLQALKDLISRISNKYSYVGTDGVLNLDLTLHGRYYWPADQWNDIRKKGYTWLAYEMPFPRFSAWFYYNQSDTLISRSDYYNVSWINRWQKEWGEYTFQKIALPVRCLKDN